MPFEIIHHFDGGAAFSNDWRSPVDSWETTLPWDGINLDLDYTSKFILMMNRGNFWPIFLLNQLSWPLLRSDIVNSSLEIQRAIGRGDLQDIPIRTEGEADGVEYRLVNTTRLVSCLDIEASCISRFDDNPNEEISSVNRMVLVGNSLGNSPPLFRPAEFSVKLLIGDALADELAEHDDLGCDLIPVEVS